MFTESILLFLLGLIGLNGDRLTYPVEITEFDYQASNPDGSGVAAGTPAFSFADTECYEFQTDGDLAESSGCQVRSADVPRQFTWGAEPSVKADTVGMVGTFAANNVDPGTNPDTGANYIYYTITQVSVSFRGGCLNDMDQITEDSEFFYTNKNGVVVVDPTIDVTASKSNGVTTYSAELPSDGIRLYSGQDIGFNIQTNSYCEAGMSVVEFVLEGEAAETVEPTKSPTPAPTDKPTPAPTDNPTPSPTTAQPTLSPTDQCKGEVTWGDPHFRLMAFDNDAVDQFNYQALGWFFYIAPCDMSQFEYFPFFLLSYHTRCYWRGNPKGCINNNRLILNTYPTPIIITFDYRNLEIDLDINTFESQNGATIEVSPNALDNNGNIKTNDNYQDKDGKRLEIVYNDGNSLPTRPNQSGKFVLFYDSDTIVIQLYDVQYDALPRRCNRNQGRGARLQCGPNQCEDLVIDIRNKATWTYYTCPTCLRNIACGLMGKYIKGDCTKNQLWDSNHPCSKILVGVDGTVYRDSSNRARGDDTFAKMADTWALDNVETYLKNTHNIDINFAKEKNTIFKHKKQTFEKRALDPDNISQLDADYYDGLCKDIEHLKDVNEQCRQETVVKYEKCCKEIGICNILWSGCVEDYCSCTAPSDNKPTNITDSWCMDTIIRDSMNATCSVDALWPTSTPTNAPTPSPTGLVAGLPKGQKAADLIWLYLIFVILFVIIAGVAYWYYRKKNGGKASFQDDVDSGVPNTSVGY